MRGKGARECRKLLVSSRNPPLEMPSRGSRGHDALAPVMGRIAACGKKPAPPGGARHAGETPAPPGGARLAGETPAPPGGARHAGEPPAPSGGVRHAGETPALPGDMRRAGETPALSGGVRHAGEPPAFSGDARHAGETPALSGGAWHAGETPALPGGARHAGETGGREIDRRDARAPRRCAARGRDRGTGDRPPRRLRFQPGCGSRARQGDGRSTAETPALPAGVRLAGETPALPGGAGTRSIPAYQDHSRTTGGAGTRSIPAYQDHSRTTPGCPDRNACYRSRCDIRRHPTERSLIVSTSVAATATGSVWRIWRTRTTWITNPTRNSPNPTASAPRSAYSIARPPMPMMMRSTRFA